jgi:hypothetical protein
MSSAGTVRYTGNPGVAAIYTIYVECQHAVQRPVKKERKATGVFQKILR